MTAAPVGTIGGDSCGAMYEVLRSQMLKGTSGGGRTGLVVLLRQGVAAWIERRSANSTGSAPVQPVAVSAQHHTQTHLLPDETKAGLVQIIASMALAGRHRACP